MLKVYFLSGLQINKNNQNTFMIIITVVKESVRKSRVVDIFKNDLAHVLSGAVATGGCGGV